MTYFVLDRFEGEFALCEDEDGNRIPFPEADITECTSGGVTELYNASDAIAMGVTVRSKEKVWLCFGAMLPNERIVLAQEQDIMLQYLNAVTKGGKARVAQRILRGVFGDQNAASADS